MKHSLTEISSFSDVFLSLRKHKPGDKKEVVVYRGWSRHVQHVPVDENGRVSISPRYLVPAQPVCVCCSIAVRPF